MDIADLASFDRNCVFETDLAIIGGGPAGLTIAREFFDVSTRVLVLESGLLAETPEHASLLEVESIGEPSSDEQKRRRALFHGSSSSTWSQQLQPYGVRCRALGGSSHAWAGKSAAFDDLDFAHRDWVVHSGWPMGRESLEPYLDRAARRLNLGPNCYDETFWKLARMEQPQPRLNAQDLRSFFWQFARSRLDRFDIMRFGHEFATLNTANVRVLLNATVTDIQLDPSGRSVEGLQIATFDGGRSTVRTKRAVLAASGIENARLLLASNQVHPNGIGNRNDMVGRFLMDHAGARVGQFQGSAIPKIAKRFGFYGLRHDGRSHMYMHGLAPTARFQEREKILNCAIYLSPDRSPDDPWDAIKRLLRRDSRQVGRDMLSILSGAGLIAKGAGMKVLTSPATPDALKDFIVNAAIRLNPNLVVEEFQSRGLPHKLSSLSVDMISEQRPDPDSRITLSLRRDRFGVPLATVNWHINDDERTSIIKTARLFCKSLGDAGLPEPILERWVQDNRPQDGIIIDMAHTIGTTRMSVDPKSGVVDGDCQVHGVDGLYLAGSSIFPTSGHANPTLMIVSFAIRLADTLKSRLAVG